MITVAPITKRDGTSITVDAHSLLVTRCHAGIGLGDNPPLHLPASRLRERAWAVQNGHATPPPGTPDDDRNQVSRAAKGTESLGRTRADIGLKGETTTMEWTNEARMSRRMMLGASVATLAMSADRLSAREASQATPVTADREALFAELGAFVERRMAELKVPGVLLGIVAGDGEHAAGFGVTNLDHPLPVDTDTLFQIGSTTKTVTATATMRLVDRGELDLEAPVRQYLPEFRVADDTVSA
ncbi:MAG: beta-lactamase family protein, partial [Chloroflexota bacterium]|nr:beta-lactamase family protein [Chloroflexota bacterium]